MAYKYSKFLVIIFSTSLFLIGVSWQYLQIAQAVVIRHDIADSEYINLASQFPAVGSVGGYCSGTLVTPNKVLTAAHCIDDNADGVLENNPVGHTFGLGADGNNPNQSATVASVMVHPQWSQGRQNGYDLAILTLASAINDVTPISISSQNPIGQQAIIVGYGISGTGLTGIQESESLTKRAANNTVDYLAPFGSDDDESGTLQVDFDHPNGENSYNTLQSIYGIASSVTPLALEGSGAPGDSGGALLADFGTGYMLIGVTSAGGNPLSQTDADEKAGQYGTVGEWAPIVHEVNVSFLESNGLTVNVGVAVPVNTATPNATATSIPTSDIIATHTPIAIPSSTPVPTNTSAPANTPTVQPTTASTDAPTRQPTSTATIPSGGQSITVSPDTEGELNTSIGGLSIQLFIEQGVVNQATTFSIDEANTAESTTGYVVIGTLFEINANASDGTAITTFTQPLELVVQYAAVTTDEIDNLDILDLYYWDNSWIKITSVFKDDSEILVELDHLTTFALLEAVSTDSEGGGTEVNIYLPVIFRS